MNFYYDPLDKACKSVTGGIARGSELTFHIDVCKGGESWLSADACILHLYQDDGTAFSFPMDRGEKGFTVTLRFHGTGLYFYYFSLGERLFLGCGAGRKAVVTEHPVSWQITVSDETYRTPEWFKGGVMYQIFPDRFCKAGDNPVPPHKIFRPDWGGQPSFRPNEFGKVLNNDFFGGDLNGIRSKLDYLAALHVSVLYLNPIFEAYSNHRYDTGDYMKIDGLLGTEEDFRLLCEEAERKGIRIILDGVFNHTGDDSRYFNKFGRYDSVGAYQSPDSPYRDWYRFHCFPDSYESWWGIETLPAVNEQSPSYRAFVCGENGVLRTWLRRGARGYRLDVADELPDFFLRDVRQAVKTEDPDALLIGEVWEDASNKIAYGVRRQYLQGSELDSVMNYPLKNAMIHFVRTGYTNELRETVAMLLDNYPKETLDCLMNSLSTHDTPRILTVLGGKECADKEEMSRTSMSKEARESAKQKLKMAAVLQYTLPGVPCVFYGDEAGLEGYMDPFCRACFPWDDIDEELCSFYRKLGEIRTVCAREALRDGEYRELYADASCLVFERRKGKASVCVWCNRSSVKYTASLPHGTYRELISEQTFKKHAEIPAMSYGILIRIK